MTRLEHLQQRVRELCQEARELREISMDQECSENKIEYERVLGQLFAISLINQYENIDIRQNRGLCLIRQIGKIDPIGLEPNGQESAQIRLFSGMPEWADDKKKMNTERTEGL